jgi:hypothetical protein
MLLNTVTAKEGDKEKDTVQQVKIGNLALPGSQQPGPLLGIGQNVIDKKDLQAFIYPGWFLGKQKNFTEIIPSILYGIRDDLSIFIELPLAQHFSLDGQHSSGAEDIIAQLEYAPYTYESTTATNAITIITSILFPTGKDKKNPPTGFGSPSFILGFTASHLATKWYCFTSYAALLTTKHNHNTKSGNEFIYQAGFGRNIAYRSDRWILTGILELNGIYTQKRKINGIVDQDSGGNVIMFGPSLWFSTQHFIAQVGVAPIVSQHLFGNQLKNSVFIACNFGWKFN